MMNPAPRPNEAHFDQTLRRLQYILPFVILAAVAAYAVMSELFWQAQIAAWARIAIEIVIFGVFGAVIVWFALGWLRRDMAAQVERDREARTQERILATITANSADAIILLDNDGKIQSWNRGAELLFGYRPAEIIGQHFLLLVPPDRHQELERINELLQEQGVVRGWITRRVTRDGKQVTVDLTRTLLRDEHGTVIGSSAILRDITEREQNALRVREMNRLLETQVAQRTRELAESNKELRKRQRELESANAELQELDTLKSEFVSLVSHELRAPLANVSGSLELLLSDANGLTAHQRDLLSLANEQVARLARLVRGILNVSRIEAGQTLLQMQAFDITVMIERVCGQWQLCDPDHTYRADIVGNLPSVWADRDRIEEVLTNLLENAFKYSDPGTEICVRAETRENEMWITVSDRGKGIQAEDLQRIFDKFYRIERGDARQTYGHGLGLYISIKLVEAMGGRLWAESEQGKGSTFYFSLPLAGHVSAAHSAVMSVN
jgi:PAS domain S-box-containing protein